MGLKVPFNHKLGGFSVKGQRFHPYVFYVSVTGKGDEADRPVDATAISFLLQPWFPALDVRASLRRLVNSYFVNFNRATGEYSLHPMDREYVYRRIPEDTEGNASEETTPV